MTRTDAANRFYHALSYLAPEAAKLLHLLESEAAARVQEIRLRAGQPLCLTLNGRPAFVDRAGELHFRAAPRLFIIESALLHDTFLRLCEYSVHTREQELRHGFVTLPGGHRAGICGTAVLDRDNVHALRDISSVNLRIAREYPDCAADLMARLPADFSGLLIAGRPGSGKTTLLRDAARRLAGGLTSGGRIYRVAVLDERGEIAAARGGQPQNDLGLCADVIAGCPKETAIEMAVRTLSPDYIIFDEIGRAAEAEQVVKGMSAGVRFIATVHAGDRAELLRGATARLLLEAGAFSHVALLAPEPPCTIAALETIATFADRKNKGV